MNFMFSRSLDGYMQEPASNDGITILHIDPKDADALESILVQYGFEIKRTVPNDSLIVKNGEEIEQSDSLWDMPEEKKKKKKK